MTAADAAIVAAAFAFASNVVPWILRLAGKRKLEEKRLTLESVRQDADRLDGSYHRLEKENSRLWSRVETLERSITESRDLLKEERGEHQKTREEHQETRRRCLQMERVLRRLGHLPADENGDPR